MKPNALAFRLFAAAALWTLIALPLTGLVLNSLVREQVEHDFDQRLRVLVTTLVAESIDPNRSGVPQKPEDMVEPLFKQPLTGWYWQIRPVDAHPGPTLISDSLLSERLQLPRSKFTEPDKDRMMWATVLGPENKLLRVVETEATIGNAEDAKPYAFAVAGPREETETAVREFRNRMVTALALFGAGLLAATALQVRFGLRPLTRIERGLAAIRSGEAQRLEGDLPEEIKPLQIELNALIQSNQDIIERARTQVGNLAHALKTPLSVITNEAGDDKGAFSRKVSEQAEIMRVQINHYLDRARMAASIGVIGGVTNVAPAAQALARALNRIYGARDGKQGVVVELECPEDARFQGEKQDLEEMLGNLMDNACKWAKSRVSLSVEMPRPEARTAARRIVMTIDDDGPGLSQAQRSEVGKRGKRLDESKPGSGLGLSIVADLAGLYRGKLTLEQSPAGGLRARLELPSV
jgi:signal transduction histidine kinase